MVETSNQNVVASSPFLSPTEFIKQKSVTLLFNCIDLNSKSFDDNDKYSFCRKVKDLSIMLERYTPKTSRKELIGWYKQLDDEIDKIKGEENLTEQTQGGMILSQRYLYALEVHEHNQRILMNSPIVEIEAEGELDITDDEAIKLIRGATMKEDDTGLLKRMTK